MNRPTVLIYRNQLAQPSEGFIIDQAAALQRYAPTFAGWSTSRQIEFPTTSLHGQPVRRTLRTKLTGFPEPITERIEVRPSLVHAHFAIDSVYAMHIAKSLKVPLITTLHGFDVSVSKNAMLTSGNPSWLKYLASRHRILRDTSMFVCVSRHIERLALANGFPRDRLVTAYIGVDLNRFGVVSPRLVAEPIILHVGRLVEKKGTSDLLRAFKGVLAVEPRCKLRIVGDGPLRSSLEHESRVLGVSHATCFLGSMSNGAIRSELAQATAFALPSRTAQNGDTEGLPVSIMEACASGVPVVSTVHAGIPEIIQHGVSGLLVEEGDVAGLAKCLSEIIGNLNLRQIISKTARAVTEHRFDLAKNAVNLERMYDEVVRRG